MKRQKEAIDEGRQRGQPTTDKKHQRRGFDLETKCKGIA